VNGKKIEIAVKKIVSGMRVVPSATVANPEALEIYYKYQDIEKFVQPSKKGNSRDSKL
jgi:acetoacetyl-CoA synthetase